MSPVPAPDKRWRKGPVHAGPFFVQTCIGHSRSDTMLARITRTYGGQEGTRVKMGTIFHVGENPPEGARVLTLERYRQLRQQGLAVEATDGGQAAPGAKPDAAPAAKPAPTRRTRVEPDSKPPASPPAPTARAGTRGRSRRRSQSEAPGEPRPLSRRGGGQGGSPDAPASSSPEDRQVGSLTIVQRGNRRRGPGGSPSTMLGSSSPGPTPSTDATPPGGEPSTTSPDNSAALD